MLIIIEISKFNAVIFTGTAIKDFEYESIDIAPFLNNLANTNIPSIGICSGAQIISKYLNLNLIKSKNIGIYELYNIKNDEIVMRVSTSYFYDKFVTYSENKPINNHPIRSIVIT